jgi:hypothetical protein
MIADKEEASDEVRLLAAPTAEDNWPSVVRRRSISQSAKAFREATVAADRAAVAVVEHTLAPAGPPATGAAAVAAAKAAPTVVMAMATPTTAATRPLRSLAFIE